MTESFPAVVFDFGGVLVQWNPRKIFQDYFPSPQAVDDFLAETRFSEWNAEQDKGRSFLEGIEIFSAEFPQYAHIIRAFHARWLDSIEGEISGTVEILRALKEQRLPLYGLSNWSMETFPMTRKMFPFFEWFDGVILSGEVKCVKPEPRIFELCLAMTQKAARECIFIDDSLPNIHAAQTMGFDALHFSTPEALRQDLQARRIL
ncbi:MAG: HAD-IA family hydrolase [Anaerolineales bacterium]